MITQSLRKKTARNKWVRRALSQLHPIRQWEDRTSFPAKEIKAMKITLTAAENEVDE